MHFYYSLYMIVFKLKQREIFFPCLIPVYRNPQSETRFWFPINLLTFTLVETLGSNKFTPLMSSVPVVYCTIRVHLNVKAQKCLILIVCSAQ